jgi:PAS domain S-box-containing protein
MSRSDKNKPLGKDSDSTGNDDKYRLLFENVHDGIYQSTTDGRILTANPALVRMLGYDSAEELRKMNIAKDIYVNAGERDKYLNLLEEKGTIQDSELVLKRKDGSHMIVLEHSHTIRNKDGDILYYEGTLTDITERKAAEKALKESEKKYQTLIEASQDGISTFDLNGRMKYFNQRKKIMLGYDSDEEFIEVNTFGMIHPDDKGLARELFEELVTKGTIGRKEIKVLKKDGSFIWAEFNAEMVRDSDGNPLYIMDTMRDITRRKRTEEDLMLLKRSIDFHYDGAYWMDRESRFIYVNDAACKKTGYTREELIGQHLSLINDDATPENIEVVWDYLEKNGSFTVESVHRRKDGSHFPVELVSTLVRFGGQDYNCGFARDITERKRNAEEIRLHLLQLRQIIDLVPSYIFAKDSEGKFLLVNKALAEVFGLDPDDIVGKTDEDYGAAEEQVRGYREADMSVIESGIPFNIPEEQVLRKDGTLGWFQTVKIPYEHPGWGKPAILGVATEITERKKVEDELRKSEQRFRKLFESHSAVKLLIDPATGAIVDANIAAADFYGWPVEKLRVMKLNQLSTIAEEEINSRFAIIEKSIGVVFESTSRLANGSIRDVEVFCSRIDIEGKFLVHSILHDITEKKRILSDLRAAKEKAEESDRLKTAFLHNISHEIRTPMNAIVGFTSLLESSGLSEETRKQYIDIVYQSSNQLLSIISDIVDISNIETGHTRISPGTVNINSVMKNLYDQYSFRAQLEDIDFHVHLGLDDDSSTITTDEIKLIQVISNLISNSFKFTKEGSINFGYKVTGDYLQFYVKDSGIGIDKKDQERIFNRFYQVESPSFQKTGGTGLGLSISKAYVELMGGKIWTESKSGEGSTFYFILPFIEVTGNKVEKLPSLTENIEFGSGKLVLVAEDDDINFMLLNEILSFHKISIIRAKNGQEAVSICDINPAIDLVLMDIKMPLMNGYEATTLIRRRHQELPVVAITAYSQETDSERILASGFSGYISKPFERIKLDKMLKKYLA